jgi:hypothetical protein
MGATIHQIGDFGWFSERNTSGRYGDVLSALQAHIRYVEDKATAVFNSARNIFAKAKEELKKRWDSRVALKFFIAVPKDWREKEALDIVVHFVSKQLGLPLENISAFYHRHSNNPHIHILAYPRRSDGKKLRIGRKELKEFHRAWDELLNELGYEIKRYKDGLKVEKLKVDGEVFELPQIPVWLLEKDQELRQAYEEYIKLRNELAQEVRRLDEELSREAEEISNEEVKKANRGKLLPSFRLWERKPKKDSFEEKQKRYVRIQLEALGFEPEDKVAVVLVAEGRKPLQRILSVEKLLSDKFLAFLKAKNSEGYNIYITLNRLKPEAKKRTKADFEEEQKAIYLDIDGDKLGKDGFELLERIINENGLPKPTLALRTSKRNVQAVWVLSEKRPAQQLEAVMKNLANKYGLDHTQDIARVFRLAGFFNRKKGKGDFVYIAKISTLKPVDFEPFEKFLPNLTALKRKREEEKLTSYFEANVELFEYSKRLDEYLRAIKMVFAKEDYSAEVVKAYLSLANDVVSGKKKFKSASEFELALLHAINRALPSYLGTEERKTLLAEKFQKLLEIVRPQKLKRNKKYVALTISKLFGTPSVGVSRRASVKTQSSSQEKEPSFREAQEVAIEIKEELFRLFARYSDFSQDYKGLFEDFCKEYLAGELKKSLNFEPKVRKLSLEAVIAGYLVWVKKEVDYSRSFIVSVAYEIFKAGEGRLKRFKREQEEAKRRMEERIKGSSFDLSQKNKPKRKRGFSPGL